jgi:erythromycin esterase
VGARAGTRSVPPTQRTDAEGSFRFTGLAAGRYGLTASLPGFEGAYRGEVEAKDEEAPQPIALSLAPARWALVGHATDPRGALVPGLRILASRVSKEHGDLWVAEPGPDGRFTVALPEARYVVSIVADGFETEVRRVASGETQPLDVRLVSVAEATAPAPDAVVAAIRAAAIPLTTVEAGHGFRDMERLKPAVGDARIVGLGEATHGSREFFQLKHRMLEFLVSEMGFSVFAIEANWPEALAVDEYVVTGRGDPAKALAGLYFWTWNTEEVLDLIRWMRRWNEDASHARKVRFAGLDMQVAEVAARAVQSFLAKQGAWSAAWDEGFGILTTPDLRDTWSSLKEERRAAASKAVSDVRDALQKQRPAGDAGAARDEWGLARQHLRIVEQFEQMHQGNPFDARERSMAENAAWVLEHAGPGARMILWAHNAHVSHGADVGGVGRPMGAGLAARFGKDYLSVGFAFDSGSFQAVPPKGPLRTFTVTSAPPGSADAALAATGLPLFALDLRALPAGSPAGDWIRVPRRTRSIGAVYDDSAPDKVFLREVLPEHHDVLLFVARTTAARPNP